MEYKSIISYLILGGLIILTFVYYPETFKRFYDYDQFILAFGDPNWQIVSFTVFSSLIMFMIILKLRRENDQMG